MENAHTIITFVIWTLIACVDHVSSELRLENNYTVPFDHYVLLLYYPV
jgi:hypothetical protein